MIQQPDDPTNQDVYSTLKQMARNRLNGNSVRNLLSETSLVHDAILRIGSMQELDAIRDEKCFFATVSYAMRSVIVDKARREKNKKLVLSDLRAMTNSSFLEREWTAELVLQLDEALSRLSALDALTANVVHFRFFLGLNYDQIAEQLNLSRRTTQRIWVYGKAWLRTEING